MTGAVQIDQQEQLHSGGGEDEREQLPTYLAEKTDSKLYVPRQVSDQVERLEKVLVISGGAAELMELLLSLTSSYLHTYMHAMHA